MKQLRLAVAIVVALLLPVASSFVAGEPSVLPATPKRPVVDDCHGTKVEDLGGTGALDAPGG